jgi:hypothetical protein
VEELHRDLVEVNRSLTGESSAGEYVPRADRIEAAYFVMNVGLVVTVRALSRHPSVAGVRAISSNT